MPPMACNALGANKSSMHVTAATNRSVQIAGNCRKGKHTSWWPRRVVSKRPVLEHQILMFESSAAVTMRRPVRSNMAQYEDAVCPTVLNRCNTYTYIT
jgi:hypothetical protein